MSFTVPLGEPAPVTSLTANSPILSSGLSGLQQRDLYLFATRRRCIASLPQVSTSAASSYLVYRFWFRTLGTATDSILIGVVASDDCKVVVDFVGITTVTISTGGPGSYIDVATGIPVGAWKLCEVSVQSNTGGTVYIHGIYLAEAVLTAADLP